MAPVTADIASGEPATGFWGPRTSTLDWCEENYATTDYAAEFWNTVSNVVFIVPPLCGIFIAWRDKVDARFIMSYIGVICIGLGSVSFHLTLKYFSQLLDEISMLWATSFFLYCMMETNSKPRSTNDILVQILYIYNAAASLSYIIMRQPLLFQVAFGALTVIMIARAVYIARTQDCSGYLIWHATTLYFVAFVLWNTDNLCCEYLQWIRDSLPSLLSPFFQLHAWWHVLVGISCHTQIQFSCHLRNTFLKRRCTIWTWCRFLPFVKVHGKEDAIETAPRTNLQEPPSPHDGANNNITLNVGPNGGALQRNR